MTLVRLEPRRPSVSSQAFYHWATKLSKWISFILYTLVYNYKVKVKFDIPYKPTNLYRSYGPFNPYKPMLLFVDIGKQCRARSDTTFCVVWSWSSVCLQNVQWEYVYQEIIHLKREERDPAEIQLTWGKICDWNVAIVKRVWQEPTFALILTNYDTMFMYLKLLMTRNKVILR